MTRAFATIALLALLGLVRAEAIVLGLLVAGSVSGVYALVRVIRLERRWERETSGALAVATNVHRAAERIDRQHRGPDA